MWENIKTIFGGFYIPQITIFDMIEIAIIVCVLYNFIKSVKNTRTMLLIKAVFILFLVYTVAELLNFNVITIIFQSLAILAVFAAIIIFQPELRKTLEKLGTTDYTSLKSFLKKRKKQTQVLRYSDNTVKEICDAAFALSETKTGALIVVQKDIPLNEYIDTGIILNADTSAALFINIFEKNTPLHDGAVIMVGDKVIAGTCYLPLSDNPNISKKLGTRHRAAIGITEAVDCYVIVVSEETGRVSYVENGKIFVCKTKDDLWRKLTVGQVKETVAIKRVKWNNNFWIKVAALITGVLSWLIVVNTLDPVITTTIHDVPVTIINEQVIKDVGKTYEVTSETRVDVRVTDVRSIVENLDMHDITVTADLSKLSYVFSVPLSATANNHTTEVSFISDNTLTVELDNIVSKEFSLTFNKIGEAYSGYYVSKITSETNGLIITGPEKIINTIDRVVFDVNVTGARENFSKQVKPVIYDKNGTKLNLSLFTLSKDSIKVTTELLNTKLIPLNVTLSVSDDALYELSINSYKPTSIRVAAADDVLEELEHLDILIKTDMAATDVTNSTFTKEVNINDFLPEGVYCAEISPKIEVLINYEPFVTKSITFSTDNIAIEGLEAEFDVIVEPIDLQLNVIGHPDIVNNLTIFDLAPYLNLTKLTDGDYSMILQYKNITGLKIEENITIELTIVKEQTEE